MNIVDFENIHRAYHRGADVLNGVTFSIEAGRVVGLVGKNGAGKTTLLRIAMGMLEAQQGAVRLFGLDPRREPLEVKRRVGFVSEDQILPPFMKVEQILDLHRGLFPTWDESVAQDLIVRFGIPVRTKVKALSKGQARQVALLCAVAHKPELLLLDEPAAGLDPAARREFLETSIQLLNQLGTTILFSSHYMSDVERLADRIVMLHEGRVLIDSELDEIQEHYSLALVPTQRRHLESQVGVSRRLPGGARAKRRSARRLQSRAGVDRSTPGGRVGNHRQSLQSNRPRGHVRRARRRTAMSTAPGFGFWLSQIGRDRALRSAPLWIVVTALNTSVLMGVIAMRNARDDSPSFPSSELTLVLGLALAVYLLAGGVRSRCRRIDMTLPLSTRNLWTVHSIATLLAGLLVILASAGVLLAHMSILSRLTAFAGGRRSSLAYALS